MLRLTPELPRVEISQDGHLEHVEERMPQVGVPALIRTEIMVAEEQAEREAEAEEGDCHDNEEASEIIYVL